MKDQKLECQECGEMFDGGGYRPQLCESCEEIRQERRNGQTDWKYEQDNGK